MERALSSYDWIGFDMDHTLVTYDRLELYNLLHEGFSNYLVDQKGYSADLLKIPYDHKFCRKGQLVDFNTGDILMLNNEGLIIECLHGRKKLTDEEIRLKYNLKIWPHYNDLIQNKRGPFLKLITGFESPIAFLIALLIEFEDVKNEKDILNKTYMKIFKDIFDSFEFNFDSNNYKSGKGNYFRFLRKEVSKYIKTAEKEKEWIMKLRSEGKKIFLLTNSHSDYTSLLMEFSYGKGWEVLFDFIVVKANKPAFFTGDNLFYKVKDPSIGFHSEEDALKEGIVNLKDVVANGNLKDFMRAIGESSSILYFGDNIFGDIMVPNKYNWDVVAIIEEVHDEVKIERHDDDHSIFTCKEGYHLTWFAHLLHNHSCLILPSMTHIIDLHVDSKRLIRKNGEEKKEDDGHEVTIKLYYPSVPKNLNIIRLKK